MLDFEKKISLVGNDTVLYYIHFEITCVPAI